MNKSKPHNKINCIKTGTNEITDPAEMAHTFNSFFTNIGPDLASKVNNCNNSHFSQYLPESKQNAMFFISTHEHEILTIVKGLKAKKSSGYDGISTKLLKQIIPNIVLPLEHILTYHYLLDVVLIY